MIFTIGTFFQSLKQLSVYIEHQLKSILAWPVCNGTGAIIIAKNEVLLDHNMKVVI